MSSIIREKIPLCCITCSEEQKIVDVAQSDSASVDVVVKENPKYHNVEKELNLSKWLRITTGINIQQEEFKENGDSIPKIVCHQCYMKMSTFYEFREQTLCSTLALKELLAECLRDTAIENLKLFCRICLKVQKSKVRRQNVQQVKIASNIFECTGIRVIDVIDTTVDVAAAMAVHSGTTITSIVEDSRFPKNLCQSCYRLLRKYVEFRKIAQKAIEQLQNALNERSSMIGQSNKMTIDKEKLNESMEEAEGTEEKIIQESMAVKQNEKSVDLQKDAETHGAENNDVIDGSNTIINQVENISNIVADVDMLEETVTNSIEENAIVVNNKTFILDDPKEMHISLPHHDHTDSSSNILSTTTTITAPAVTTPTPLALKKTKKNKRKSEDDNDQILKKLLHCSQCDKKFRKKILYDAHINQVHCGIEKPFVCKHCSKTYGAYKFLRRHIKEVHPVGDDSLLDTTITMVNESSNDTSSIPAIAAAAAEESIYQPTCNICCRIFKRREHVREHLRVVHERKRPFKCDYCEKSFASRKTLRIHEMSHTGQRPHKCEQCNKAFRQGSGLRIHMELHTTPVDLICPICKRAKASAKELQEHLKDHKVKMYKCSKCNKEFKKKSHMLEHMNAIHLKIRPFKCYYCEQTFAFRKTCNNHELTHTKNCPLACTICQKTFRLPSSLRVHMKEHTWTELMANSGEGNIISKARNTTNSKIPPSSVSITKL